MHQSLSLSEYLRSHHKNTSNRWQQRVLYDPQSNATLSEGAAAAAAGAGVGAGAAAAAAATEGFLIIAFNIDACRSTFCCFGAWGSAACGSGAEGAARLVPAGRGQRKRTLTNQMLF
jgi:hypothetical protein